MKKLFLLSFLCITTLTITPFFKETLVSAGIGTLSTLCAFTEAELKTELEIHAKEKTEEEKKLLRERLGTIRAVEWGVAAFHSALKCFSPHSVRSKSCEVIPVKGVPFCKFDFSYTAPAWYTHIAPLIPLIAGVFSKNKNFKKASAKSVQRLAAAEAATLLYSTATTSSPEQEYNLSSSFNVSPEVAENAKHNGIIRQQMRKLIMCDGEMIPCDMWPHAAIENLKKQLK